MLSYRNLIQTSRDHLKERRGIAHQTHLISNFLLLGTIIGAKVSAYHPLLPRFPWCVRYRCATEPGSINFCDAVFEVHIGVSTKNEALSREQTCDESRSRYELDSQ